MPFEGLFVISSLSLATDAVTAYPRATASLSSRNIQRRVQIHSFPNRTQAPHCGCSSSHLTFLERQVWHPRRDLGSLPLWIGCCEASLRCAMLVARLRACITHVAVIEGRMYVLEMLTGAGCFSPQRAIPRIGNSIRIYRLILFDTGK